MMVRRDRHALRTRAARCRRRRAWAGQARTDRPVRRQFARQWRRI